ncbi:MAG: SLC13 family permease [Bacteroidetes bacterium]|nr:SLC13 family permease [Bacteroidota bacterium]MCY4225607.1 SLC13 family permease [Bacteroidota bacterium]
MDWQAWLTVGTIVGIAVALVKDLARPDAIFLSALGILLAAGIITPSEAFAGFSNGAVIALASLFVVAAGIEESGLLRRIEWRLLRRVHQLPISLLRMMVPTALISAFMNNTPVVAMWIKPVQRWAYRSKISPSKMLIPLSYASIAGGMVTLMGSSTNVVVAGLVESHGFPSLGLFDFSLIGFPAAIVVLVFLAFVGVRFLPDRTGEPVFTRSRLQQCLFEIRISDGSSFAGLTLDQAKLDTEDDSAAIVQVRRGKHVMPVDRQFVLGEGDVLCFSGDVSVMEDLLVRPGLESGVAISKERTTNLLPMYEAVISDTSNLVGKSLEDVDFLSIYGGVVLAIQQRSGGLEGAMANVPLRAGDLILVGAVGDFEERWSASHTEFYYVLPRGTSHGKPPNRKILVSLGILVVMVIMIAFRLLPLPTVAFGGALAMVMTRCIGIRVARNALDLQVLLLIAAALGIGVAVENTGVADGLAQALIGLAAFSPILALFGLYACTNVLTELIANKAAAVLMLPVAFSMSASLNIEPKAFILAVAVAAAASFMTPVGYQTNLMVMAAGNYKVLDYIRVGLPISFLVMTTAVIIISMKWL